MVQFVIRVVNNFTVIVIMIQLCGLLLLRLSGYLCLRLSGRLFLRLWCSLLDRLR